MSYNNFSELYKVTLINAENRVKEMWFKDLRIEDVFIEIFNVISGATKDVFDMYGISQKLIIELVYTWLFNDSPEKRKWVYSWMNNELKNIILSSVKTAASFKKQVASIEDFILAVLNDTEWFKNILDYIWITPSDLENDIIELNKKWIIDWWIWQKKEWDWKIWDLLWTLSENIINALWEITQTATPFDWNKKSNKEESNTPALDYFCVDLTKEASEWKLDKVIWREKEIERLIAILNRKTKNNPSLIWEPWVGKTAVVEWLAQAIAEARVPFSMKNKRILSLDLTLLVAWTKYRWEFEARIKQVIDEASQVENEIILFIDEIHTIIWAGSGEWTLDASNILKPAMWRWKIRIIWATTLKEYQKYIEKDSALERRFQKIEVAEPDINTAIEIISWLKETFEEYHNLNISDKATKEAILLSSRYITDRFLPDKAIDLIDEACSLKSMNYEFDETETKKIKEKITKIQKEVEKNVIAGNYEKASQLKKNVEKLKDDLNKTKQKFKIPKKDRLNIIDTDIQKVLSLATGIPVSNLSIEEIKRLKNLPKKLKEKIIWQDEAIENIVKSIMRSKAWIANKNRPTWSFLFLGPTWVGKTELVKVLAQEFFADKDALIKIDMSEYSDKTSVNKLIWSSAWYVGYEEWGYLTERVRRKPYSIVLFDEIEKWDFEIFNLLLQVLEDWILTDNKWRKVSFKNTIIIMTSNLWAEDFNEKAQRIWFNITENEEEKVMADFQKAKEKIMSSLSDFFSPEFLNRIDKITVFEPLDKKDIKKIVELQLQDLTQRLSNKNVTLSYDTKVLNFITKQVYNPEFWAREIRRYIMDNIEDKIAEQMIFKPIKKDYKLAIDKQELKLL